MNALVRYFKNLILGAWSLITGLWVTIRYMFKPVATVQYPRKCLPLPEAYRGHIELKKEAGQGDHLCVACGECQRTCPSGVIKVQGLKSQASDHNRGHIYFIDFSRCSLCGLCVEVCPKGALAFSREYEQAPTSRYEIVVDLMRRYRQGAKR
ncbi:MAG: NADH-quinone oxidoreductase subunit I [Thermodesulfobacteriota bacterium]